ncbi:MAG: DEAD/DEAH box helicase [Pseudomonas sp.]|uniref:DEAD/DEAH box helicase n=1 Tax=Pseudomonas sp. TaxID=306 RepID=UPI0012177AA8|nr:DEAD/DEAH box helicase family protein [Pseudomonas sp.]RZI75185.1 MAG: DEAD/DEAH box helicase [Pseudomonas sp.]
MTSPSEFTPYWDDRLREYQKEAIRAMRAAARAGARNILICAPTGSGKTEIAACLADMNRLKGKRSAFVVDRKSLIHQTSAAFDVHGIDHGVIQADHPRYRPSIPTQVCSVQTIARRRWPDADLVIVDEAHAINKVVVARIGPRVDRALGLTATPFTKSLGKLYDCVINVTTTNKLIEDGYLSKYRIFACAEPDMEGVKVVAGEFERKESEKRALQVVGDVVAEYLLHGEDRKFICSAVDTAHVMELQRQFLAAGVNAATYTYKDLDEDRDETVAEFRRPESSIRGLITVTAASKGFDVPDIGCVIMGRPLRKSLAEHIQFFGRGLRIHPDKTDCIVLDHSGNCARFWEECNHVFEHGASELDMGTKHSKPKLEKKPEDTMMTCSKCKHLHKVQPFCPSCGHEYPRRRAVEHVAGSLKEVLAAGSPKAIAAALWPQVCAFARERDKTKPSPKHDGGRGYALWLYREIVGDFPQGQRFEETVPLAPNADVLGKIKSIQIRNAYRWRRQGASA